MCTVLQQTLGDQRSREFVDSTRRQVSPVRHASSSMAPTYSYLADIGSLRRPIDPSDRASPHPNTHFHVPPESSRRSRASYIHQLYGRSRSASRNTGMRLLVDYMRSTTPRPKSPHMNNEEPIGLAHYPDGKYPQEDKPAPIERDDFPAPPFFYLGRKRHWSEPGMSSKNSNSPTPPSSPTEEEVEEDPQLEKSEQELKKISTAMGQIFLTEIAIEKERRKSQKGRYIDPRSAARSPAANKEPHFRLRYESPVNASPSRIADHLHPWEESGRRHTTATPITPSPAPYKNKSSTLPSRFSPYFESTKIGEDDDDASDISGGGETHYGERPRSGCTFPHTTSGNLLQAANIYPAHLLFTTNYRLPGDVDRCNLEKHLSDEYFDILFDCSRLEFYQLPYWKRCELKKKNMLF